MSTEIAERVEEDEAAPTLADALDGAGAADEGVAPPRLRRPISSEPTVEKEAGPTAVIEQWLHKLRNDDQAYIVYNRIKPEYIDGVQCSGWSERLSVSSLRNADDLLNQITNECGGTLYDLKFSGTHPTGKVGYMKQVRISINAPAKLRTAQKTNGSNGNGSIIHPDSNLAMKTNELLSDMVQRLEKRSGGTDEGVLKVMKEMTMAQMAPVVDGYKKTIDMQERQLTKVQERLDNMADKGGGVNADMLAQAEARFGTERTAWNTERERMKVDHDRISKDLQDKHAQAIKDLQEKLSNQVDKLTEKMESAQDKLREVQDKHREELARKDERRDEDVRRKDEAMQAAILRKDEDRQREAESLRREKENECKRLADQLSDERRSNDKMKDMYDLNTKTQLDKQEGIYREQIKALEGRLGLLEERNKDTEKRLQEKISDLEKRKDELQNEVLKVKTDKPDPLASLDGTLAMVERIGGRVGLEKKGDAGPQRTEIGQLLQDAKDSGVLDAAKSAVTGIAGAFMRQPQQQQPQVVYAMPPGFMPPAVQMPVAQPAAPQQPRAQPAPQPQPQPQQPPQPAPTQMSEQEEGIWKLIIGQFEEAMDTGVSAVDMGKRVHGQIPLDALKQILTAGVTEFRGTVRYICSKRPENPDSLLLSPRGETWLREVFAETAKLVG